APNVLAEVARSGTKNHAAATPERRLKGAGPGAPGALLPPRLLVAAGDFAHGLGAGGAHALVRTKSYHHIVNCLCAKAPFHQWEFHFEFALVLAVNIFNGKFHASYRSTSLPPR